jgi:hypothetical protein
MLKSAADTRMILRLPEATLGQKEERTTRRPQLRPGPEGVPFVCPGGQLKPHSQEENLSE